MTSTCSELDKLIHNCEFENKQYLKLIEHENNLIERYEQEKEASQEDIKAVKMKMSQVEDSIKQSTRQASLNLDNIASLKSTNHVLTDHVAAMETKLDMIRMKRQQKKDVYDGHLKKYRNIWSSYKKKYETFPFAAELSALTDKRDKLKQEVDEKEMALSKRKQYVYEMSEKKEAHTLSTTAFIVKLAENRVEAVNTDKLIQEKQEVLEEQTRQAAQQSSMEDNAQMFTAMQLEDVTDNESNVNTDKSNCESNIENMGSPRINEKDMGDMMQTEDQNTMTLSPHTHPSPHHYQHPDAGGDRNVPLVDNRDSSEQDMHIDEQEIDKTEMNHTDTDMTNDAMDIEATQADSSANSQHPHTANYRYQTVNELQQNHGQHSSQIHPIANAISSSRPSAGLHAQNFAGHSTNINVARSNLPRPQLRTQTLPAKPLQVTVSRSYSAGSHSSGSHAIPGQIRCPSVSIPQSRSTVIEQQSRPNLIRSRPPTGLPQQSSRPSSIPQSPRPPSSPSVSQIRPPSVQQSSRPPSNSQIRPPSLAQVRPPTVSQIRPPSITGPPGITQVRPPVVIQNRPPIIKQSRPPSILPSRPPSIVQSRPPSPAIPRPQVPRQTKDIQMPHPQNRAAAGKQSPQKQPESSSGLMSPTTKENSNSGPTRPNLSNGTSPLVGNQLRSVQPSPRVPLQIQRQAAFRPPVTNKAPRPPTSVTSQQQMMTSHGHTAAEDDKTSYVALKTVASDTQSNVAVLGDNTSPTRKVPNRPKTPEHSRLSTEMDMLSPFDFEKHQRKLAELKSSPQHPAFKADRRMFDTMFDTKVGNGNAGQGALLFGGAGDQINKNQMSTLSTDSHSISGAGDNDKVSNTEVESAFNFLSAFGSKTDTVESKGSRSPGILSMFGTEETSDDTQSNSTPFSFNFGMDTQQAADKSNSPNDFFSMFGGGANDNSDTAKDSGDSGFSFNFGSTQADSPGPAFSMF